jgi:hypothetical protein
MLSALIQGPAQDVVRETVSTDEQKRCLKRWIDVLSVADRKAICNILVMNNRKEALKPCSEGTVINLDNLPASIIEQMYNLAQYRREARL